MSEMNGVYGLYLTHGGESLRLREGSLIVEREDTERKRIPLECIDVLISGAKTRISSAISAQLRERKIAVSFLDWKGSLQARIEPHPSRNALIRRAQLQTAENQEKALQVARWIVVAKLANQKTFLLRTERKRKLGLTEAIQTLEHAQHGAASAKTRESLMGYEGHGARSYFDVWPLLLQDTPFTWNGRNRRPPLDPINALLSLGYVVATARCTDAAAAVGLDPYVGFLHAERYGRAELGLDLVEEFRTPWIDSLILGLIGRKQVSPDDFSYNLDGSCSANDKTRRVFFRAFSKLTHRLVKHPASGKHHPLGMFPIIQARLLGKYCFGELEQYPPFLWR